MASEYVYKARDLNFEELYLLWNVLGDGLVKVIEPALHEGSMNIHELRHASDPIHRIRIHALDPVLSFGKRRCPIVALK